MQSDSVSFFQRHANSLKGVIIFLLMLILLIPTAMIEEIIRERQSRQNEAVGEVAGKWGLTQTVTGPVLVLPYQQITRNAAGQEQKWEMKYAYVLPDDLRITGEVFPEKRYRGIFEVVVYNSKLALDGTFSRPALDNMIPAGAAILWDKAVVQLGIPDLRGLKEQVTLVWDDRAPRVFDPGLSMTGVAASGIHIATPLSDAAGTHRFHIDIALQGSGSLFFTPVGKVTEVNLRSAWSDPSFTGAFLPDQKNVAPTGFDAQWKVLNLNRNYPQAWGGDTQVDFSTSSFGVDFLLLVDNYQKSIRSVKYAVLFIGLTFLVIFFVEMRNNRRVHPFQYALIPGFFHCKLNAATDKTPAVSVRRRAVPSPTPVKPCCWARATSSGEKSPSGPMAIRVLWPAVNVVRRWGRGDAAHQAIRFWFSEAETTSWRKGTRPWSCGSQARSDCFIADTSTFSSRSSRTVSRSDRWQWSRVMSSTPISVAFSRHHSRRSICLVGAMARCSRAVRSGGAGMVVSNRIETWRLPTSAISPSYRLPRPSVS